MVYKGFVQSKNDYSLFIKRHDDKICIAVVYVDDVIVTGDDDDSITDLKSHLHSQFGVKDLGLLHYFLGIEVNYTSSGIVLCQQKFAKELLRDFGFDFSQKDLTPLPVHLRLSQTDGAVNTDPELYRSLVGKFNYLMNTRPDLSFTVQALSQYMHSPCTTYMVTLRHTLCYLAHTIDQGILLQASDRLTIQAFSDAD